MNKKKKLARINKVASSKILEVKAILDALSDLEQDSYPANILLDIAKKKSINVFNNIENNRRILQIAD